MTYTCIKPIENIKGSQKTVCLPNIQLRKLNNRNDKIQLIIDDKLFWTFCLLK